MAVKTGLYRFIFESESILLTDPKYGTEPSLESMVRQYYHENIPNYEQAEVYATRFLEAMQARLANFEIIEIVDDPDFYLRNVKADQDRLSLVDMETSKTVH